MKHCLLICLCAPLMASEFFLTPLLDGGMNLLNPVCATSIQSSLRNPANRVENRGIMMTFSPGWREYRLKAAALSWSPGGRSSWPDIHLLAQHHEFLSAWQATLSESFHPDSLFRYGVAVSCQHLTLLDHYRYTSYSLGTGISVHITSELEAGLSYQNAWISPAGHRNRTLLPEFEAGIAWTALPGLQLLLSVNREGNYPASAGMTLRKIWFGCVTNTLSYVEEPALLSCSLELRFHKRYIYNEVMQWHPFLLDLHAASFSVCY